MFREELRSILIEEYQQAAKHEKAAEQKLAQMHADGMPYSVTWQFIIGELNTAHVGAAIAASKLLTHLRETV